MTIGLIPGDHRINDAWHLVSAWTIPGYFLALPAGLLTLTAVLAYWERRRGRRWRSVVALCLIALVLGGVSWIASLVGLATTIWNV